MTINALVVTNAVEAMITIDQSGVILNFNPAATQLFGFSSLDMIGCSMHALVAAPHTECHARYIQDYLATGSKKMCWSGQLVSIQHQDGAAPL